MNEGPETEPWMEWQHDAGSCGRCLGHPTSTLIDAAWHEEMDETWQPLTEEF